MLLLIVLILKHNIIKGRTLNLQCYTLEVSAPPAPSQLRVTVTGNSRMISAFVVPCFFAVDARTTMGPYVELCEVVWLSSGPYMVQSDDGPSMTFGPSKDMLLRRRFYTNAAGWAQESHNKNHE